MMNGTYFRASKEKGLLPLTVMQAILAETSAATRGGVVYLNYDPRLGTVVYPATEVDQWKALPQGCILWEPGRFLIHRLLSTLKERNGGELPEGVRLKQIKHHDDTAPSQHKSTTTPTQLPIIVNAFGIEGHPEIAKAMREIMAEKPDKSIVTIRQGWMRDRQKAPANTGEASVATPERNEVASRRIAASDLRRRAHMGAPTKFGERVQPSPPPKVWKPLFAQRDALVPEIDWFRKSIGYGGPDDWAANIFKACRSPQHFPLQLEGFLAEMTIHASEFLGSDKVLMRFNRLHQNLSELYGQARSLPEHHGPKSEDSHYEVPRLDITR